MQIRELNQNVTNRESTNRFFPNGYTTLEPSMVMLGVDGNDRRSDGFIGNIRNLKIFSKFYDDDALTRVQFIYIYPFKDLKMQILINNLNDYKNEAGRATGYVVGQPLIR